MSAKRSAESDSESSDDDDYGPAPVSADAEQTPADTTEIVVVAKKKRRKLKHEKIFVEDLPSAPLYEHSYMHRDLVTHIVVSKSLDFIITGSSDGHVKFWKKMLTGIEFVKHYQAHLGPINDMVISPDGQRLVTTSEDKMLKVFDVSCYDMTNMISLPAFTPGAACWIPSSTGLYSRVAVADKGSGLIRVFNADDSSGREEGQVALHSAPVRCLGLNVPLGVVISADTRGMIEYWSCESLTSPELEDGVELKFRYKTETDLYALAKGKVVPSCVSVSPRGDSFAVTSRDKQIRIFDFLSGKLRRTYNESSAVYSANSAMASSTVGHLSEHDLGRRLATERELEADTDSLSQCNCVFDDSGNFLIYSSLLGVKVLNVVTNRVVATVGSGETGERFLAVALYQGTPKVDTQLLLARSAGGVGKSQTSEELSSAVRPDPTVFCTSFKKRRFFCISRREPDESQEARDVLNEKPTEDERVTSQVTVNSALGSEAMISTNIGEIVVKLFADACPKTIENFCTHARNGYYDNLKFHRVIKGFMIQTGDPLGDGTGGESIWGGEFPDEFDRNLRHDRPFTVSMANAGPNTNGSQFFITTAPTPWLDNKHTVFGRVTSGFEVVSKIENKEVDKYDRPYDEVKMLSIAIKR